jgi:hypothetical protein
VLQPGYRIPTTHLSTDHLLNVQPSAAAAEKSPDHAVTNMTELSEVSFGGSKSGLRLLGERLFATHREWDQRRETILDEMSSKFIGPWSAAFERNSQPGQFSFCLGGSLQCGHLMGPKSSRNPNVIALHPDPVISSARVSEIRVVEADYRLVIPDHLDPISVEVKNLVESVTGLRWAKDKVEPSKWRKDRNFPHSVFYGYLKLEALQDLEIGSQGAGYLECELSVVRRGEFVEVSDYWDKVFTPEEVRFQALCRQNLRDQNLGYDVISVLKGRQCDEARGRILLGHHLGRVFHNSPQEFIADLVPLWSNWVLQSSAHDLIKLGISPQIIELMPAPPKWVSAAMREQRDAALRRKIS